MSKHRWMALLALLPLACADDRGADDEAASSYTTADATDESESGTGESGTSESDDIDSTTGDGDTTEADTESTSDSTDATEDDSTDTTEGDTTDTTDTTDTDTDTTTTGDPPCPLADAHVPCDADDDDPFHAIGLDCPGQSPESTPISGSSFSSPDNDAWKVANQFGSSGDWTAHEGEKLLIISTGELTDPDNQGAVILDEGIAQPGTGNGNPDGVGNLPNPIEPQDGSGGMPFMDCDGVNDCSDTLQAQWELGGEEANDLLSFTFDIEVPAEASGYEFDFAFFSSEFPEWVDTMYNDIFVVWSTSETYTGNVTFIDGQPLTITAIDNLIAHQGNSPLLEGTGVDGVMMGPLGGATGWFTASGSAAAGETFSLTWAIFDMGDEFYDTTVLLDAFRWDCEGCVPSEVDGCGIDPQ
jgi:hypothetical protein